MPASYVFTATFLKFIQLLHVLIGQSIQPSDRDVRDGEDCEDCDIRNGGSCGIRDGDARSSVRDCSSFMGSSILQGLVRFICVYSYPLKIIQLLHVLIGQSFQSSARDVWDGGACCVRDGGARGGGQVGGACVVRDGGSRGGVRVGEVHSVSFSSAAPSLVLALSFCNDLPASYVFTATFLKYIQLLHVMIGQSFQLSNQDVRDSEAGCF